MEKNDNLTKEEAERQIALYDAWFETNKFKENRDHLAGLRAFVKFSNLGYAPPPDLMKWVVSSFEKYLESDESMDKAFCVSQQIKRMARIDKRNLGYVIEIKTLVHNFDVTTDEAIGFVERRLEENGTHLTSLKDIYDRDGGRITNKKHLDELFVEIEPFRNMDTKTTMIAKYPPDVRDILSKK